METGLRGLRRGKLACRTLSPDNEGMETFLQGVEEQTKAHRRTLSPDNEGMETFPEKEDRILCTPCRTLSPDNEGMETPGRVTNGTG